MTAVYDERFEMAEQTGEPESTEGQSGYNYESLMKAAFHKPQPIVSGFAYEGHSAVFAAAFGQGKTFFALQLSVALATGRDFLGKRIVRPYRTTFLDAENGKGELTERLRSHVASLNLSRDEMDLLNVNWRLEDYEDKGPLNRLNLAEKQGFRQLNDYVAKWARVS